MLKKIVGFLVTLCAAVQAYAIAPTHADIAYGADPAQKLDVYVPASPVHGAPVILMVHGGAWRIGDKQNPQVVDNKGAHFLSQGYLFVSTNYRMSKVTPLDEAEDIASALRYVQAHATEWGGDAARIVLMGHSAGAHLVSLLNADPKSYGLAAWRGTVSLDSAAYNVPALMQMPHFAFYDDAFGTDTAIWKQASPAHRLTKGGPPMLLVCSSQRILSCGQANDYAAKVAMLGGTVRLHSEDLSHMEINNNIGLEGEYTQTIDAFLASVLK